MDYNHRTAMTGQDVIHLQSGDSSVFLLADLGIQCNPEDGFMQCANKILCQWPVQTFKKVVTLQPFSKQITFRCMNLND